MLSVCCAVCDGFGSIGGVGEGSNRVTRSRSSKSSAESSSFGNRTCKVKRTERSAGEACLRGLADGVVVVVVDDLFRDWMSDVMKARDCGRGLLLSC